MNEIAFRDLINKINADLGIFCMEFAENRKKLNGSGKTANNKEMFNNTKIDEGWSINYGGGTEVQYHIGIDDIGVRYGIGFNFQYVPFKNDKNPIEYMEPFAKAFFSSSVQTLVSDMKLKGYCFIIGDEETLKNKQYEGFYLFGKLIKIEDDNSIEDDNYMQMLDDIKGYLFTLYKDIFAERNRIVLFCEKYTTLINILKESKNLILTGAPGTGKTYLARNIAASLILDKDVKDYKKLSEEDKKIVDNQIEFVQFHPSFDYTDFVEGIRPTKDNSFERQDGIFKAFCKKAIEAPSINYVFIIDEINRGDLNKILGELFYAIDSGYRGVDGKVTTQYQKLIDTRDPFQNGFYIPENVYIIGTMNDIDRSVDSMDFAIRRRFVWQEITYDMTADEILQNLKDKALIEPSKEKLINLNDKISNILGNDYNIGASYFLKLYECGSFEYLWNNYLKGVIFEYFRTYPKDDREKYMEEFKNIVVNNKSNNNENISEINENTD